MRTTELWKAVAEALKNMHSSCVALARGHAVKLSAKEFAPEGLQLPKNSNSDDVCFALCERQPVVSKKVPTSIWVYLIGVTPKTALR